MNSGQNYNPDRTLPHTPCLLDLSPRPQALWDRAGFGLSRSLAAQVAPGSSHHSPPLLFVPFNFTGLQPFGLKFSIRYLCLSPNTWGNFPWDCLGDMEVKLGNGDALELAAWGGCRVAGFASLWKQKQRMYGWSRTGVEDWNTWHLETATPHIIFLPSFLCCCVSLPELSMLEVLLGCRPTVMSLQTNLSVQSCLHLVKLWTAAHHAGSTDMS